MRRMFIFVLLLTAASLLWGQYVNAWGAVTNGGTEFPNARWGAGYKLADNIGRGTSAADTFLTDGVNYVLYPGYRYVELDLRNPTSWIDSTDTISHSPSFVISWGGTDTTIEDGEGWGIRFYDVEYSLFTGTVWVPWFTGVTFTDAIFGPTSPVTVEAGSTYFFRVKAYDYATNVETDHAPFDQKITYQPAAVSFMVYNPTSGQPIWEADTFDPGQTVSMQSEDVLVVKNTCDDTLILALRGFPVAYDTSAHLPFWSLSDLSGPDTFAIRAEFDDNTTPPITFGATDAVRDSFILTDGGWYGGPTHGRLLSYSSGDSAAFAENLWMQVRLPTSVTVHGDTTVYQFTVQLKAQKETTP